MIATLYNNGLQVAQKNRSCYRQLRTELEELTGQGVFMLAKFEEEGANMMQRLAVQMLCYQLENTWQYFTTTFKIQVGVGACAFLLIFLISFT